MQMIGSGAVSRRVSEVLQDLLQRVAAGSAENIQDIALASLELAKVIQHRATELQTPAERRQQAELDRMIQHPQDKATLTQMTDQAFRSETAARAVDQLVHILDVQGVPRFFSPLDRTMLRGFQSFGGYLPGVAVPLVKEKMRKETANVILPAEREMLREHLNARRQEGVRMNVNLLGESLLGEEEAQRRLEAYLAALQMPEIECVSIKISTLYSQISTLARRYTIKTIADRLELLYRAAARNHFTKVDGSQVSKFVYLDMEEYRDMSLTSQVFMQTLDRPGMEQVRAGIALQAYIPDSFAVQEQITEWARTRVEKGGAPVTIRIVKGANMEMERVEASLRGWPQAPYKVKIDTDANYKRMVIFGMKPGNIQAAQLGIASHNLFEVAFSFLLAAKQNALHQVQFEMLEGMANHQRRALREIASNLLLYAPACKHEDFIHAIGYLVRRMDENTGPDNFLRHAFKIEVDSPEWKQLERLFLDSVHRIASVSAAPRRTQDRRQPCLEVAAPNHWNKLENEADTDFSLPHNSLWAQSIIDLWHVRCDSNATRVLSQIAGTDIDGSGAAVDSLDPSRPGVVVARYRQADAGQIQRAIECAASDPSKWRSMPADERYQRLRRVAQELRKRRADLLGAALADGGKTLLEGDPEVSEAIDFVEFYSKTAVDLHNKPELKAKPRGVIAVISPWNFPIAIPCGGIAAALAAGNTVILKPASDTTLPARVLCECFWDAGVPREALQFVICSGGDAGKHLLSDSAINTVILTGGTETAQRILAGRPDLHLLAETGGKNATIVSNLSDRDMAIKNVLHSAFSHAGQKCSATSLLLLDDEVYHDKKFREGLIDALQSLKVGSAWDLKTKMGPLIRPPEGGLLRGLKELEPGEVWALMPQTLEENACLYTPGLKWDVAPGNFTHLTELFGPVLGVMKYRNLQHAIDLVHATGYGLTSGLESLDDREQAYWSQRMQAGNLYINRSTTGAIVLRQPFGGMGKSAFGPGIKAGGLNYVVPLMDYPALESADFPTGETSAEGPELESLSAFWQALYDDSEACRQLQSLFTEEQWQALQATLLDYDRFAVEEILQRHDHLRLLGQDNFRLYQPMKHMRIRVESNDSILGIVARTAAVMAVGGRASISHADGVQENFLRLLERVTREFAADIEFIEESDEELIEAIGHDQVDRIRYASPDCVPLIVRQAAHNRCIYVADTPVSPQGRIELLWYVCEQSLCIDYHRYGNLGFRATEQRAEPL
jgi:RHH-type transcriptional regulator, proline utilization regulon repressor / proline dehydrogenase / delta 1-pyrroline-5-carboxylate dehydrogenase